MACSPYIKVEISYKEWKKMMPNPMRCKKCNEVMKKDEDIRASSGGAAAPSINPTNTGAVGQP